MLQTVNPTTGEALAEHEEHDEAHVEAALARSFGVFHEWRETSMSERSALLGRVADQLELSREALAILMVEEMGKPISGARAEVDKCVWVCRWEAEHAPAHLAHDVIDVGDDARKAYVRFDPLGPLLAVMPWNFPLWQVFRAAAPNVMAGNPLVLKHASNVPACAKAIEQVFHDAGAPVGLFTTLLIDGPRASALIGDPRIRAVTLTGSVAAGRAVAAAAGQHLKPVVLELGGSDAFVVLEDADIAKAAKVGAQSRMLNNGQSCIAAKRFVVVDAIADQFAEALREEIAALVVGDPMDEATDVGPLAREDLRDDLHDQVARAVAAGATATLGGRPLRDRAGWFYAPTVLTGVGPQNPVGNEETFGPAAAVLRVPDQEAAIAVSNASDFGLGASIWTQDRDRGEAVAARVEAGCTFVNQLVKSDPRVPFGGVKDSGHGRELGSYGVREFVNAKTVWVE